MRVGRNRSGAGPGAPASQNAARPSLPRAPAHNDPPTPAPTPVADPGAAKNKAGLAGPKPAGGNDASKGAGGERGPRIQSNNGPDRAPAAARAGPQAGAGGVGSERAAGLENAAPVSGLLRGLSPGVS
jgi:hypothetical protein